MLLHNIIKMSPTMAIAAILVVAGGCSSQQQSAALRPAQAQVQTHTAKNNSGTVNYCKNVHWGDEFAAN